MRAPLLLLALVLWGCQGNSGSAADARPIDARAVDAAQPDATSGVDAAPADAAPVDAVPVDGRTDARPAAAPAWALWLMPDSKTIYCTDGSNVTACPAPGATAYGQDGNYVINAPSYTTTTDTVTDQVTGLTWQRSVAPSTYDWAGAVTYCAGLNLAGLLGWRLPTRIELVSILDFGQAIPAIDSTTFPTGSTAIVWSSSVYAPDTSKAWTIQMWGGHTWPQTTSTPSSVRCVR